MSSNASHKTQDGLTRIVKSVALDWSAIPSVFSFAIISVNSICLTNYDPAYWDEKTEDYLPTKVSADGLINGVKPVSAILRVSNYGHKVKKMQIELGLHPDGDIELITPFIIEKRPDHILGTDEVPVFDEVYEIEKDQSNEDENIKYS